MTEASPQETGSNRALPLTALAIIFVLVLLIGGIFFTLKTFWGVIPGLGKSDNTVTAANNPGALSGLVPGKFNYALGIDTTHIYYVDQNGSEISYALDGGTGSVLNDNFGKCSRAGSDTDFTYLVCDRNLLVYSQDGKQALNFGLDLIPLASAMQPGTHYTLSRDLKYLAVSGYGQSLTMFDLTTQKITATVTALPPAKNSQHAACLTTGAAVYATEFLSGTHTLLFYTALPNSAQASCPVNIYDPDKKSATQSVLDEATFNNALGLTQQGNLFIAYDPLKQYLSVVDLGTNKLLSSAKLVISGLSASGNGMQSNPFKAYSPDGNTLLFDNTSLQLVDRASSQAVSTISKQGSWELKRVLSWSGNKIYGESRPLGAGDSGIILIDTQANTITKLI